MQANNLKLLDLKVAFPSFDSVVEFACCAHLIPESGTMTLVVAVGIFHVPSSLISHYNVDVA